MSTSSSAWSSESRRHRVVVGSSFAGLTAALEVKRRLKKRANVTVIDQRDYIAFEQVFLDGRKRESLVV